MSYGHAAFLAVKPSWLTAAWAEVTRDSAWDDLTLPVICVPADVAVAR